MMTLSIVPQDSQLGNLIAAMNNADGLPLTNKAMESLAIAITRTWQLKVGPGKKINRPKRINPFTWRISSDDKVVHWLEVGLPAYDMRRTHPFGKKGRVTKPKLGPGGKVISQWKVKNKDGSYRTVMAGSPYLIVPFFHKTSAKGGEKRRLGDVYRDVLKQTKAEGFQRSTVTTSANQSSKASPNAFGEMIQRAEYDWGSRIKLPEEPENQNLQDMVVMNQQKQTQYMTFRVVSVNSPASTWQHPGIQAKHHLENTVRESEEVVKESLDTALKGDLGDNSI